MTTEAKPVASNPKSRPARRGLNFSAAQALLVVGIVFGLSVIINFSGRIQAEQKISAQMYMNSIESIHKLIAAVLKVRSGSQSTE